VVSVAASFAAVAMGL